MAKQPISSGKVSKIEARLKDLCQKKEYYEAHQLYKTVFNRYVNWCTVIYIVPTSDSLCHRYSTISNNVFAYMPVF